MGVDCSTALGGCHPTRSRCVHAGIAGTPRSCYSACVQAKATIDERGAIAIPAAMRQALGLRPSDEVLIEATQLGLLIRPVLSGPLESYTEKRIAQFASDDEAIGELLRKMRS